MSDDLLEYTAHLLASTAKQKSRTSDSMQSNSQFKSKHHYVHCRPIITAFNYKNLLQHQGTTS